MGYKRKKEKISMTTGDDSINEDLPTIAEDLVVTKYKMSAEIVNKVLKEMITECKPGCSIRELCILGDKKLTEDRKGLQERQEIIERSCLPHLYLRE